MPVFAIEVQGRAVLAFVAPNLFTAEAALDDEDERIRDGLANVAHADGSPLLRPEDVASVREATPEEAARWHAGVTLAIQEGALQDEHSAVTEGFAVYLVEVAAANDDDFEFEIEEI